MKLKRHKPLLKVIKNVQNYDLVNILRYFNFIDFLHIAP
jgi:hypothetical protein